MRTYLSLVLGLLLAHTALAQNTIHQFGDDTDTPRAMPRQHVRTADVAWSKTIWREIDFRERKNQHFYFPETPQRGAQNFIHVLIDLVQQHGITPYTEEAGDEFAHTLTKQDVNERLGQRTENITVDEPIGGTITSTLMQIEPDLREVKKLLIKEVWFFDRQQSKLEVRILGICPIREYFRPDDTDQENPLYKKIGWFYFPEIEKHLTRYSALYGQNPAQKLSFFDIFAQRYFTARIVQEYNPYNNSPISDYATGQDALLEHQRIDNELRQLESDLWGY